MFVKKNIIINENFLHNNIFNSISKKWNFKIPSILLLYQNINFFFIYETKRIMKKLILEKNILKV